MFPGTSTAAHRIHWTTDPPPPWKHGPRTRVTIGEFSELVTKRLETVLAAAGFDVVAVGVRVLVVSRLQAELVILNLASLKPGDLAALAAERPEQRLAVLADRPTCRITQSLVAQGAGAVLPLSMPERDLVSALRLSLSGLSVADASRDPIDDLTGAERRVYDLLCTGLGNAAIANELHIGTETVRTHARRIYAKLGVSGRIGLIAPMQPDGRSSEPRTPRR